MVCTAVHTHTGPRGIIQSDHMFDCGRTFQFLNVSGMTPRAKESLSAWRTPLRALNSSWVSILHKLMTMKHSSEVNVHVLGVFPTHGPPITNHAANLMHTCAAASSLAQASAHLHVGTPLNDHHVASTCASKAACVVHVMSRCAARRCKPMVASCLHACIDTHLDLLTTLICFTDSSARASFLKHLLLHTVLQG